jgi:hypothetical protein
MDFGVVAAGSEGKRRVKATGGGRFGVVDVVRDGKNMKAAANSKMLQQNATIAAQNAIIKAKNEAKLKAQQEAAVMKMSHSEREAYKKILQEQRVSTSVKKANDDEALSVGHLLIILVSIIGTVSALWFGAVALGIFHK